MIYNYFDSGYGKREHDCASAVKKHALTSKQLDGNGEKLQNVHKVVS